MLTDLAKGIGETLRGTLNSAIDEQYPRKNADKAAAARLKNESVLNRGRGEMAGIPTRYGTRTETRPETRPEAQPESRPEIPRTQTSDQSVPGQWSDYEHEQENAQANVPPSAYGGAGEAALGEDPPETRKAKSIGKLFKRKPVAGGGGELRVTNP